MRHPADAKPYNPEPLDATWVLIGFAEAMTDGTIKASLMDVTEDRLEKSLRHGWSIVFRWRDDPKAIDPHQSNPNRTGEDEGD